jgi:2-(1,2-epoxy-1,2-dihydrophenyl)acetyl-CoA isomerase
VNYESIRLTVSAGVARLMLNRPDKLNSFTAAMHAEIRDALARVRTEPEVRALLVTGAGRAFCAGQDLADFAVPSNCAAPDLGETVERDYAPLVRTLRTLPLPVVCAVNGIAAGAGANLALACDVVIAKESAAFLQPFCKLGLVPDTGGTYFLPRLVGMARAMSLVMLGEKISAQQAAEWGLIWKCVSDADFDAEVEAVLAQLGSAPTLGLARIKQAIYASADSALEEQLLLERDLMRELGRTRDYREGVDAFLNKRTPEFHGR